MENAGSVKDEGKYLTIQSIKKKEEEKKLKQRRYNLK